MKQRNSEENLDNYTTLDSCETSIVIKSESNDSKDHRPFNKLSLPINSLGREINIGPNVNINLPKKSFSTLEEKLYKKNKIQMKKKTEVNSFLTLALQELGTLQGLLL